MALGYLVQDTDEERLVLALLLGVILGQLLFALGVVIGLDLVVALDPSLIAQLSEVEHTGEVGLVRRDQPRVPRREVVRKAKFLDALSRDEPHPSETLDQELAREALDPNRQQLIAAAPRANHTSQNAYYVNPR